MSITGFRKKQKEKNNAYGEGGEGDRRLKTRSIACFGRALELCMLCSATNHRPYQPG